MDQLSDIFDHPVVEKQRPSGSLTTPQRQKDTEKLHSVQEFLQQQNEQFRQQAQLNKRFYKVQIYDRQQKERAESLRQQRKTRRIQEENRQKTRKEDPYKYLLQFDYHPLW